jgi:hypothetical protein
MSRTRWQVAVVGLWLVGMTGAAWADWQGAYPKWVQPDALDEWGLLSHTNNNIDVMTADDWECTSNDPLVEIGFHGWDQWIVTGYDPHIAGFNVRIWTDVPANQFDESHPGALLWEHYFPEAHEEDPHKIGWQYLGNFAWKINIAQHDWFYQQGSASNPIIYWISIQGVVADGGGFYWGFRDREQQAILDDAAWLTTEEFTGPTVKRPGASGSSTYQPDIWYHAGCKMDGDTLLPPFTFEGPLPADGSWSIDMKYSLLTIPEPATLGLLGAGWMLAMRRRR